MNDRTQFRRLAGGSALLAGLLAAINMVLSIAAVRADLRVLAAPERLLDVAGERALLERTVTLGIFQQLAQRAQVERALDLLAAKVDAGSPVPRNVAERGSSPVSVLAAGEPPIEIGAVGLLGVPPGALRHGTSNVFHVAFDETPRAPLDMGITGRLAVGAKD